MTVCLLAPYKILLLTYLLTYSSRTYCERKTDPVDDEIAERLIGAEDLHGVFGDVTTSGNKRSRRIITAAGERRQVRVAGVEVTWKHGAVGRSGATPARDASHVIR